MWPTRLYGIEVAEQAISPRIGKLVTVADPLDRGILIL